MRKLALCVALGAALIVPSAAAAKADCTSYSGGAGPVYTSGGPATIVGICVISGGLGGNAEVGGNAGSGFYLVVDGADANPSPGNGYMGLSNYEKPGGTKDTTCDDTNAGTGTNSGGCFGVKGVIAVPLGSMVPTPICGNTSGDDWDASTRDGCLIP
jgi:hypothetical protein